MHGLRAALFVGCLPSCSTTLEPTVIGAAEAHGTGGDGGSAGAPVAPAEPSSGGAGSSSPLASCPTWTFGSTEYVGCPHLLPYDAAVHDCRLRGGRLAVSRSEEINEFLGDRGRWLEETEGAVGGYSWLGGMRDDDHVWRWLDGTVFWQGEVDGSPEEGAFVNWAAGEPNNASTMTNDPERCLALAWDNHAWNDRTCSLAVSYFCEREL